MPVIQAPELKDLFPKRESAEFNELKESILESGQEGKCLYCLWDNGNALMCIDGTDTSRAIGELQHAGRAIEVAWELYTPKATEPAQILIELMAIVIRRKLLQTAVQIPEEKKKSAILEYLKQCYASMPIPPTNNWVATDLGCSQTWVSDVREEAMEDLILPRVDKYLTRNGKEWPVEVNRDAAFQAKPKEAFKEVVSIPITQGMELKTEDERLEELERQKQAVADLDRRARERAEREADRISTGGLPIIGGGVPALPIIGVETLTEPAPAITEGTVGPVVPTRNVIQSPDDEGDDEDEDDVNFDDLPEPVVKAVESLEGLYNKLHEWMLTDDAEELIRKKAWSIIKFFDHKDELILGIRKRDAEQERNTRSKALGLARNWNIDHGRLPEDDVPWLVDSGIIVVNEDDVDLIEEDQFRILLKRLGPVVMRFGGNAAALETCLDADVKPPSRRKKS